MAGNPVKGEWFTILRAGEYPGKYPITSQDVQDMADDYNASFRMGTVGIGHPNFLDSGQQPNLAVVSELRAQGNELRGRLSKIASQLVSDFTEGRVVSWSGRIIPPFLSETGRMYLSGVDFLGVAQPAIGSMRVAFDQTVTDSYCAVPVDKDKQTQPLHQEETPMSVTLEQVNAELTKFKSESVDPMSATLAKLQESQTALTSQISQLTAKIEELNKRPAITADELSQLKATTAQVTDLKAKNDALLSAEADNAVAEACRGIPAGHCPEAKKQLMKKWYTEDRPAFDLQKAEYDKLRPTLAKTFTDSHAPDGEGPDPDDIKNQEGYMENADELANKRSVRAFAILKEQGKKKGDPDFAHALGLAQQQACKEITK